MELLRQGKFGLLVPVVSVPKLINAIRQTLENPLDTETLNSATRENTAANSVKHYLQLLYE